MAMRCEPRLISRSAAGLMGRLPWPWALLSFKASSCFARKVS
ncbi:MAG: hypothetical protein OK454_07075 [Thaumarchaeota archaeon]|nr:hypothetical protein [Nitrososphaerota archaeon]